MNFVETFRRALRCLQPSAVVVDFDPPAESLRSTPVIKLPSGILHSVGPVEACASLGLKEGEPVLIASYSRYSLEFRPIRPEEARLAALDHYRVVSRILETMVELAVEGVEGDRVGTLCVISEGADRMYRTTVPVKVEDVNVMTGSGKRVLKALAKLDGAIVVDPEGNIEAAGAIFDVDSGSVEPGLGARHTTALHVSKELNCPVIVLSESGRIRLYHGGKEVLKISVSDLVAIRGFCDG
ncbi:DNA integrity scanning protein DisA nucleotide-binding domain protein [Methanopyrus kandleri]